MGQLIWYNLYKLKKEVKLMKGYVVNEGYMGMVEGEYILFSCELDYREYMEAAIG